MNMSAYLNFVETKFSKLEDFTQNGRLCIMFPDTEQVRRFTATVFMLQNCTCETENVLFEMRNI